jgi:hypothetical protein
MSQSDERLRVLKMVESGQVKAEEGARLLDALSGGREQRGQNPAKVLRVRVTDVVTSRQKVNVTVPVTLIGVGVKLGARLLPQGGSAAMRDLQRLVESGASGRIFEMQDLEEGERVEIFVE